jgi:hypothetical protein
MKDLLTMAKKALKLAVAPVVKSYPIAAWILNKYNSLLMKLGKKDGQWDFLRIIRAGVILVVGTFVLLYGVIFTVIPGTVRFAYDAVSYEAWAYDTEPMYFSKPEWVSDYGTGDEVLSVFGCDKRPCTEDNSREYRFRDSLYLDVTYWLTRFEPYDHADVAGIMQSELNYCSVKAYSHRFKPLNWYPYIFNVECYEIPGQYGELK